MLALMNDFLKCALILVQSKLSISRAVDKHEPSLTLTVPKSMHISNEYTFLLLLDTNLLPQAGITHYSQLHDITVFY